MIKYNFNKIDNRKAGNIPDGLIDDIIDSTIRKNAPADIAEQLIEASLDDIQPGGDPRFVRENLNAVAEMNKRLVKAGIDINALQGGTGGLHSILPTVGRLQGDVPGPYIESLRNGNERRTHLTYEDTDGGVRGVVPYMDPAELDKPLKTTLGLMNIVPPKRGERNPTYKSVDGVEFDNPSEYAGMQVLKLMGKPAVVGNSKTHRTDLKDPTDLKMGNIDVEKGRTSLDKNTLPLHMTSSLMS